MAKIYIKYVILVLVACILAGFVLPALFSAKSTFAVWVGVAIVVAIPVFAFWVRNGVKKDVERIARHIGH